MKILGVNCHNCRHNGQRECPQRNIENINYDKSDDFCNGYENGRGENINHIISQNIIDLIRMNMED
jgi:hypothetical protein